MKKKNKKEKYYRIYVGNTLFMFIYKTGNFFRNIYWKIFKKEYASAYKKYKNDLLNVKRLQKNFIKINKLQNRKIKNFSDVPLFYYRFNSKTISIKIRFLNLPKEINYENFLETIVITSNLKVIEKIFKDGFYYVELGLLADNIPEKVFIDNSSDKLNIPIATSFGKIIYWNIKSVPHALFTGSTGSGKTTFVKYVLSNILRYYEVNCIDGKSIDYIKYSDYFKKYESVLNKENCISMIKKFNDEMLDRFTYLQEIKEDNIYDKNIYQPKFLMIDEYTSFIESLDKKTKAEILNLIGNIARLGRAVGMILILLMQRPDTTFLSGEIRNNFLLRVVLGPNGNEIYRMMFDTADDFENNMKIGQGYARVGGKQYIISVPYVKSIEI